MKMPDSFATLFFGAIGIWWLWWMATEGLPYLWRHL